MKTRFIEKLAEGRIRASFDVYWEGTLQMQVQEFHPNRFI